MLICYIIHCIKQTDMINDSVNTSDTVLIYINKAHYTPSWLILNETFDNTDIEFSLTTRTGPLTALIASSILSRGGLSYNINDEWS